MEKNKIVWLAVLQGWSMLLVVLGHVTLTNVFNNPNTPVTAELETWIYSFHMPLFMFISGYLFFFTKMNKRESYFFVIKDKLKRLGIPFLFFTVICMLPKLLFSPLMKRPVDISVSFFVDTFLLFKSNPLGEMWFIVALFFIMLLYPLFVWSMDNKWKIALLTALFTIIYIFAPRNIMFFQLNHICDMLIFFYLGILFCKYELYKLCDSKIGLFLFSSVWFVCYVFVNNAFLNILLGILCSFFLCINLAGKFPNLFSSFRDYTFQIFLMGIFFQMLIRFLFLKLNLDVLYAPMFLLSVIIGIYGSTVMAKMIKFKAPSFIRQCFGLK